MSHLALLCKKKLLETKKKYLLLKNMCLRRGIRRRCIMIIVNAVQRRFKIIYFRFEKKMRFHGKNINNFFFHEKYFFFRIGD